MAFALLKIQIASKTKELESRLGERDTRVDDFLTRFKQQLTEDISSRIHRVYNQLSESVENKIGSDDYQSIHFNGYVFLDHISWDNFNESGDLKTQMNLSH
ncbi:MAG: hypothetical protein NHB32_25360 [Fischerella sp. CENA71]|nr:hypothetical protein [Fischerella sp. CENA71]